MTDYTRFLKYLIPILLLLSSLPEGKVHAQKAQNPLQKLQERFQQGQIFHAGFTHIYKDSYTGQTQKSSGEVWVGDEEYKVIGKNQRVLVYQGVSRVYDETKNRVVISKYHPREDDFAPSKFLAGTDTLYQVEQIRTENDTVHITLKSGDPFTVFKRIELALSPSLIPLRIRAIDQADNKVITRFENGRFISGESGLFKLDYPKDAKIIDLRE